MTASPPLQQAQPLDDSEARVSRVADALPTSARARFEAWLRPPRKLKFTQVGRYFTGMTILIGFGAINTGNNLLYLLLGMMLTLIVISGILSESVIQSLAIERRFPGRVYAGRPTPVELVVENLKGRTPSFSIQILDRFVRVKPDHRPAVYLMRLDAGQTQAAAYRFAFPHRGRWRTAGVEIATRFPFDLFLKSREVSLPGELVVFPQPLPSQTVLGLSQLPLGDVPQRRSGHGGDFHGIRDYRAGDDMRDVHWKLSAKRDQLITREYEREEARAVTLCFYNAWIDAHVDGEGDAALAAYRDALEFAVASCAGLAQDLLSRGYAVGLVTCDGRVQQGTGAVQLDRILHALALARFCGDPSDPDAPPIEAAHLDTHARDRCILVGHAPGLDRVELDQVIARVPCRGSLREAMAEVLGEDITQEREDKSKFGLRLR